MVAGQLLALVSMPSHWNIENTVLLCHTVVNPYHFVQIHLFYDILFVNVQHQRDNEAFEV